MIGAALLLALATSATADPARAWAGEVQLGLAHDYGGWGDGRRFSTVEAGAFVEHRHLWLSGALSGSLAGDHHQEFGDHGLGHRLHLGLRLGIETAKLTLRMGPALSSGNRGERGTRAALVPLGSVELRHQWDGPTYFLLEGGGRGTHATIGEGVHIGFGRRHAQGRQSQDTLVSLYVASLVGVSARARRNLGGDDWIFAAKAGLDVPQAVVNGWGRLWSQKAFELAFAVGRPFGGRPPTPAPLPAAEERPTRHGLTAALASLWHRTYAAEYEWHGLRSRALFVEPAWQERTTAASIRLSGPLLGLGWRYYPTARAPAGFWFAEKLVLGVIRASGWDSLAGPLGPHTDSQRFVLGVGVAVGFNAVIAGGIVLSLGLGPELTARGFHSRTGRFQDRGQRSLVLRVNLGRAS